jgi:hypothetical protein
MNGERGPEEKKPIEEKKKPFEVNTAVDEMIQELLKEKQDNPDLLIPYSFIEFYNHELMLELISAVHRYAQVIVSINSQFLLTQKDRKEPHSRIFSEKQSGMLPELGRAVAQQYGQLLLRKKGLVNSIEDQSFFETVIFFTIRVVKTAFNNEHSKCLDDELNRLFRSTAFNIALRKNTEVEKMRRSPQLKLTAKRDADSVINGILMRNCGIKSEIKNYSLDNISRPAFYKITPYKAISSRSPLISMLLPSSKDRIREFEEIRRRLIAKSCKLPEITRRYVNKL